MNEKTIYVEWGLLKIVTKKKYYEKEISLSSH